MKQLSVIFGMLCLFATSYAQDGIQFVNKPWKEIIEQAKQEDKLIFVDAYTSWCGPCKSMSANVFPDKKVGEFFNAQFINAKIDMEKGEGPKLAQQYKVRAYPTFLFVDGDGKVVHQSLGYHDVDQLLDLGGIAANPMMRLSSLDAMYAAGDRSSDFLYNYTMAKAKAMDGSHQPVAEQYLETQSNWKSEKNMEFIYRFMTDTHSKMFDFFVKNKADFIEKFGEPAVSGRIRGLVEAALFEGEGNVIANAERVYAIVYPEKADQMISQFKMSYYLGAGDSEKYAESALAHYKKYAPRDYEELNETAWNFYELVDDKKYLKKAVKLAKKSIAMQNAYYNNDTLAALYYKLGKKKKALAAANKAIYLAKEEGEQYQETEELLEKIKQL